MASIRLNDNLRSRLNKLRAEIVKCPVELAAVEAMYNVAEPLVRATVVAAYPPADMEILKKYEVAFVDDCIKLQLTSGGVDQFNFKTGTGPMVAKPTYTGKIYLADEETTDAVANWSRAKSNLSLALGRKHEDYRSLITSARTLEEVIEIWPEAEQIAPFAHSYALTALSADAISRIKEDVRQRQAATETKS